MNNIRRRARRERSRDEREYNEFLHLIKEEREDTSNFAKSLLTFVLGVCCVLIFALVSLSFFALMLNRLHFLSICEQTDAGNPGENQFPWL